MSRQCSVLPLEVMGLRLLRPRGPSPRREALGPAAHFGDVCSVTPLVVRRPLGLRQGQPPGCHSMYWRRGPRCRTQEGCPWRLMMTVPSVVGRAAASRLGAVHVVRVADGRIVLTIIELRRIRLTDGRPHPEVDVEVLVLLAARRRVLAAVILVVVVLAVVGRSALLRTRPT